MAQKKMNVRLLRRVQKHILAEPRRYDQNVIIETDRIAIADRNGSVPACGTMACIGGWAYILGTGAKTLPSTEKTMITALRKAGTLLGLRKKQWSLLFSYSWQDWPEKFKSAYDDAKSPRQKARVASRRIDHFIKTNGAE